MIEECIQICKDSGIRGITGNFIIGGAGEDGESLAESRELAAKLLEKAKGILELYMILSILVDTFFSRDITDYAASFKVS